MRVLIIEDEANLRDALSEILENRGFETDTVSDGKKGLHAAMSGLFDVIVLDLMLPKLDGFELLKKLRRNEITTPVIVSTAMGDNATMQKAMDCGADDYVTKPFNVDELTSKIKLLSGNTDSDVIQLGDISLNRATRVVEIGGKHSEVSPTEVQLLLTLMENESRIIPYAVLSHGSDTEELDAYIAMLSRKLNYLSADIDILHVKGVGYKLMLPDVPQIEWEKGF